ncbi:MAG: hypothetical protein F4X99_19120 [Gammaproteobacteria bacterium]|nr:hypothetical protein [Gammaproteobacteria bacterium]
MEEPLAPFTRADLERFAAEIREEIAAVVAASARAGRHDVLSDILMQLRILKWVMGLGFVAIMGALGGLYHGQADLLAELRAEFRAAPGGGPDVHPRSVGGDRRDGAAARVHAWREPARGDAGNEWKLRGGR